jgi:hypothetical protein
LDLVEVAADGIGLHIEAGMADDGFLREIGRAEIDQGLLAEMDRDLRLLGLEAPGQVRGDAGVEAHHHVSGRVSLWSAPTRWVVP